MTEFSASFTVPAGCLSCCGSTCPDTSKTIRITTSGIVLCEVMVGSFADGDLNVVNLDLTWTGSIWVAEIESSLHPGYSIAFQFLCSGGQWQFIITLFSFTESNAFTMTATKSVSIDTAANDGVTCDIGDDGIGATGGDVTWEAV